MHRPLQNHALQLSPAQTTGRAEHRVEDGYPTRTQRANNRGESADARHRRTTSLSSQRCPPFRRQSTSPPHPSRVSPLRPLSERAALSFTTVTVWWHRIQAYNDTVPGYVRRSLTRADVTSSIRLQATHFRRCRLKLGRSARALAAAFASARLIPNRKARHASQYEQGGSISWRRRAISEIRLRRRKTAIQSPVVPATSPLGSRGVANLYRVFPHALSAERYA